MRPASKGIQAPQKINRLIIVEPQASNNDLHDRKGTLKPKAARNHSGRFGLWRQIYRFCNTATPGRLLPSRNSNEAPPPVDTCVTRSATPA